MGTKRYVPSDDDIKKTLQGCRTIAVVGLSPDESRPSYGVAGYLKEQGFKIVPVRPGVEKILEEKAYPDLRSVPDEIDVVDIFRRSEFVPEIVDEAIAKGAKVVWMQEGVINEEAAAKAEEAGLRVVMDRCMLKEHRRLISRTQ